MALAALFVAGLLAACGPEDEASSDEVLTTETERIAQEYAQDGDIARARAQLQELDAANPIQWLVYLTETRLAEGAAPDAVDNLVKLAVGLGTQSRPILDRAAQLGLINRNPTAVAVAPTNTPAPPPTATAAPLKQAVVITAGAALTQGAGSVVLQPTTAPTSTVLTTDTVLLRPTATPATSSEPMVLVSNALNVRGGPGTDYPILRGMEAGAQAEIVAKNPQADWWQVRLPDGALGWVYGALVQTAGATDAIAVAADIPAPPPTATPAPVAVADTPTPAPAENPPAENPPAENPPAEQPTPAPPPVADGPDFVIIEKRLWEVYENGGVLNGPTVTCGLKRELHVNVVDANGAILNGVAVQAIYGAQEIYVTGAQGKGDGQVEFVLGRGQGVKVVRDNDGREVTSDVADGLSTVTYEIPYSDLIAARYCTDEAECKQWLDNSPGCYGHHSWTVTFKRKY